MPLVLPLVGAWGLGGVLALLDGRRKAVAGCAVVGLFGVLAASCALLPGALRGPVPELVAGGWAVGVGIRLRADLLSVLFCIVTDAVLAVALGCEALRGIHTRSFPALVLLLAAGLNGAFLTADAFNFYVFFELSMGAAFALVSYGRGPAPLRAGFTFMVVNLMGSVLFLTAVVMLYQATGTLDMGRIAAWVTRPDTPRLDVPGALLLSAFGVKLGLFPFHFWAPAVYRGVNAPIAALLAGALANLGSYGLVRMGPGVLHDALVHADTVLGVLGGTSIVYGALLALARQVPAEVLAYTSIAQAGYLFAALGLGQGGVAAAVLLARAGSLDKAVLFLSVGHTGPRARAAFLIGALSTAGVPLSVGFLAKVELLRAALLARQWVLGGLVVLSSVLALVALLRTFQRLFWADAERREARAVGGSCAVVLLLALGVVGVGVWPEPMLALGRQVSVAARLAGGAAVRAWLWPWLGLTGVYLLMVGSVRPGDVVLGGAVAAGLLAWSGRWLWEGPAPRGGGLKRAGGFVVLWGVVLREVARGTWRMMRVSLGRRPGERQGVVEVPLGERSQEGARVSALVWGMVPGSVLLETDWERRVMRFHVVDASEPEAFVAEWERFYREHQRAVFP